MAFLRNVKKIETTFSFGQQVTPQTRYSGELSLKLKENIDLENSVKITEEDWKLMLKEIIMVTQRMRSTTQK